MPLELTTPINEIITVEEEKSIKEIEVTDVNINLKDSRLTVKYIKKYDDGQGGTITGNQIYTQVYADIPSESITDYTDMMMRNMSTYGAVKLSTYEELMTSLGITGNIV